MRCTFVFLLLISCWQIFLPEQCGAAELRGRVVNMDKDPPTNVPFGTVRIKSADKETTINADGTFYISGLDYQPGEEIKIEILNAGDRRNELILYQPLNHMIRMPGKRGNRIVQIGLLPKGSHRFLSNQAMENLLQLASKRGFRQKMGMDLHSFLEEWANEHGLDPKDVASRVAEWADEVERQPLVDLEKRALAAVARDDIPLASHFFGEAARDHLRRSEGFGERADQERQLAVADFEQSGDVHLTEQSYPLALQDYQEALDITDHVRHPRMLADLKMRKAIAETGIGETQKGDLVITSLKSAINDCQEALQIYRDGSPYDSALTQNVLGVALGDLGERTEGAQGQNLLTLAVAAFEKALNTLTQFSQEWAQAQNNLGNTLRLQGQQGEGTRGWQLLSQALKAHTAALQVSKDKYPQEWALAQNGRGNVMKVQAERSAPLEALGLLTQAADSYRNGLSVLRQADLFWATLQNNLGIVLLMQGLRSGGEEARKHLAESVDAHRSALEVFTIDKFPQDWATTQNNRGNALLAQAERSEPADAMKLLVAAEHAFEDTLQVFTRDQAYYEWAAAYENLGSVLTAQAERAEGEKRRRLAARAVEDYQQALQVRTLTRFPNDFAETENNLGTALQTQGQVTEGEPGERLLMDAVQAYQEALRVRTPQTREWAITHINLGNALRIAGERASGDRGKKLLTDAIEAYRNALTVFTSEGLQQDEAITETNLANALEALGERTAGEAGKELLADAVEVLQRAARVLTRPLFPEQWAATQYALGKTLAALGEREPEAAQRIFNQAAEAYSNVLQVHPTSADTMERLGWIFHERLFDYQRAFAITKQRLDQAPHDGGAATDFIQTLLTTRQFSECVNRAANVREILASGDEHRAAVYLFEATCHLAQTHITEALASLRESSSQFAGRRTDQHSPKATLGGTKYFISNDSGFVLYRKPLLRLYDAFESGNVGFVNAALKEIISILAKIAG